MSRKRSAAPKYRYHVSGQAVVRLDGKDFYLGAYDSPESHARYHALLAQYNANGRRAPDTDVRQANTPVTVRQVTAEFRNKILPGFKANNGQHTRYKNLLILLDDEHGDEPAEQFGPRKLEAVRSLFVASGNCRRYANEQTRDIVRIFRYGVSRELISENVIVRLKSLEPLKQGQAKDNPPREPVEIETVIGTMPELTPTLQAMVRIQVATGMRPSEVFKMTPADIDRSGEVWMYRPGSHKTRGYGVIKAVPIIGDAHQAILPYMLSDGLCFVNSRGNPWDKDSYRQAIGRAAKRAGMPHWTPYQLRHLAAQAVRDQAGLDAATALLGHTSSKITETHYARRNEVEAIKAARAAPRLDIG